MQKSTLRDALIVGLAMIAGITVLWQLNQANLFRVFPYMTVWAMVWGALFYIAYQHLQIDNELDIKILLKRLFLATVIGTMLGKVYETTLILLVDPALQDIAISESIAEIHRLGALSEQDMLRYERELRENRGWNTKNFIFSLLPIWIIGFFVSLLISWISQRIFKKIV